MRSTRHRRRRDPSRKHPTGARKKPRPPGQETRAEWRARVAQLPPFDLEDLIEWVEREQERQYWEEQREKSRRKRDASDFKKRRL